MCFRFKLREYGVRIVFQNEKKKMLLEHLFLWILKFKGEDTMVKNMKIKVGICIALLFLNVGCAVVKDSTGTQIDETGSTQIDTEREYVMVGGRKYYIPNMDYDPESDSYICRNGKQFTAVSKRTQKIATGYQQEVTIYECNSCDSCPYKKDCIKGNNCKTAFEERNKKLSVSRKMEHIKKKRQPLFCIWEERTILFQFCFIIIK